MRFTAFRTYPLPWVALAAALLGIAITLAQRLDPMLNPDSVAFVALAKSVLAGTGLRYQEPLIPGLDLYAFRAPGYPLFLALGFALGGVTTVIALQGALNGLAAALVGDIATRLGGGPRAAWIAFALRFAWPTAWFHSGLLLSEVFYEFLCVLATWLVLRSIARRELRWTLPAAAATVMAILCRPVGLGLALALGGWLLFRYRRAAFAYAAAAVLLWAPWPIRNAIVLDAVIPFTSNGGATAWAGTTADGQVRPAYDWMGANVHLGEVGFDRHFRRLTLENVRRDPGLQVRNVLNRAFVYLGPIRGRDPGLWVHRFAMLGALTALVLGLLPRLTLPVLIWALQGAMMLPIYLIDRYRFPTDWCVVLAAAIGIAGLVERIGPRRAGIAVAAALVACIAGSYALSLGVGGR